MDLSVPRLTLNGGLTRNAKSASPTHTNRRKAVRPTNEGKCHEAHRYHDNLYYSTTIMPDRLLYNYCAHGYIDTDGVCTNSWDEDHTSRPLSPESTFIVGEPNGGLTEDELESFVSTQVRICWPDRDDNADHGPFSDAHGDISGDTVINDYINRVTHADLDALREAGGA